ncbi:glutamate--cysteine ligase [Bradymonas sediminis]|nr:glutamate--cysteine ligase [Bradymonas sediminis]
MSRDINENLVPIESREQLVEYFAAGEKPREEWGVGTEHEKFMFRRDNFEMASYDGDGGIGQILARLRDDKGWEPAYDNGDIVALEQRDPDGKVRAITLEPGGQFELSGAVYNTVYETADELDSHFELMREMTAPDGDNPGMEMVCWGANPFFDRPEIPWMPKSRYKIMREYMPKQGDLAHSMMKQTCTVQANFDYATESDASEIIRTSLLISPIASAIFANSPFIAGEDTGMQTFRGHIWTRTDPARCGWPEFMYRDDWGYADYLEYILDVPMFFIARDGKYINKAGDSFRDFMKNGHGEYNATMGDFELHLSTAFPEIRLKRFVEIRGADAGPRDHMVAMPALWKGILYHEPARKRAADLLGKVDPTSHAQLFHDAYKRGLKAESAQGTVRELAGELLSISADGLDAIADAQGHPSERLLLAPLEEIVNTGKSLADQLRDDWESLDGDRQKLVEKWAF